MVVLYIHNSMVLLIVPVTVSAVVPIPGLTPLIIAIITMVLLNIKSLVGGVRNVTRIPLFWLDDISMTSPASLNDC